MTLQSQYYERRNEALTEEHTFKAQPVSDQHVRPMQMHLEVFDTDEGSRIEPKIIFHSLGAASYQLFQSKEWRQMRYRVFTLNRKCHVLPGCQSCIQEQRGFLPRISGSVLAIEKHVAWYTQVHLTSSKFCKTPQIESSIGYY